MPAESTRKVRKFRVEFGRKLSLPASLKYGWIWSCPGFFKSKKGNIYEYSLYHNIKKLTFIIKFDSSFTRNLGNSPYKPKLQAYDPSGNPISIPEEGIPEIKVDNIEYKWIKMGKPGFLYKIFWG